MRGMQFIIASSVFTRVRRILMRRLMWVFVSLLLLVLLLVVSVLSWQAWQRSALLEIAPSVLLLDRHGEFLAEFPTQTQSTQQTELGFGYWPVVDLPERFVAATLALEDRRFYQHQGVDFTAIFRAL